MYVRVRKNRFLNKAFYYFSERNEQIRIVCSDIITEIDRSQTFIWNDIERHRSIWRDERFILPLFRQSL